MSVLCKKRTIDVLEGRVRLSDSSSAHTPKQNSISLAELGLEQVQDTEYNQSNLRSEVSELFINVGNDDRPHAKIYVYDIPLVGLLDSGARDTVLGSGSMALLNSLKLKIFPSNVNLVNASGAKISVEGFVYLPITFNDKTKIIETLVAPTLKRRLFLGSTFWKAFNIEPSIRMSAVEEISLNSEETSLTLDQENEIEKVKQLFKAATSDRLDTTSLISHTITIADEAKKLPPIRLNPFPTSPKIQSQINSELDSLLELGIIERSNSDWALRLVPVSKPNGKIRLCLDARGVNERTVRDSYPLPHCDRILSRLGPCKYISTIDLTQAFLQVPLHPRSRKYTAFSVYGRGLFQFTRMPFGLVNSPATQSRLMDRVLGGGELEPKVFVYLDDIIVATETFEEHLAMLTEVAIRLTAANLSINLAKSKFCVDEVPYLGYLLSKNGLRPNPERVEAIVNYERPQSLRALRRFLGMCNYYRRFIPQFSEITVPLTNLLKNKPRSVKWNDEAEKSFFRIKESLISAPILCNPDYNHPFTLQTDASDTAIAAVLTQVLDGHERVIAYFSQKLSTQQQRYHAAEKEGLAVLKAIEKFRGYIEGSRFTVLTDASAVTHILRGKWRTSSRLSRWALELQQHDMVIRHRKGSENVVADALSRSVEELDADDTDEWYTSLHDKVLADPDQFIDFKVEGDILWKYISSQGETLDYQFDWKICVPKSKREKVLVENHDDALHLGAEKTYARIKRHHYWPNMYRVIKDYVSKCSVCKQCKPSNRSQIPELGQPRITTKPFQIIAIDFIQSLPRSKHGNTHLFVIMDLFSKWSIMVPVRRISASQVCELLENLWFRRYSVPEFIISDNATTFYSKEFKTLLERFKIQHWANSRHYSQANPVERLNRTINACIRTYARDNQRTWDDKISEIEFALNTTPHSSTGFSPYRILFGHEVVSRGDEHRVDRDGDVMTEEERIAKKNLIDVKVYQIVKKNLEKARERTAKTYNLRFRKPAQSYSVGQKVLKRNFKQSSAADSYNAKLGACYVPCTVIARIGTSSYELADEKGKSLGVFSSAFLKPDM